MPDMISPEEFFGQQLGTNRKIARRPGPCHPRFGGFKESFC
jgi:hypothetical protein